MAPLRKPRVGKLRTYDARIATLHRDPSTAEQRRRGELDALIDMQVEGDLAQAARNGLADIQAQLMADQADLDRELEEGRITDERHMDALSSRVAMALGRCRQFLGDQAFDRLFGEAGHEPEGLLPRRATVE